MEGGVGEAPRVRRKRWGEGNGNRRWRLDVRNREREREVARRTVAAMDNKDKNETIFNPKPCAICFTPFT